jgi:hypothetical protein
MAGTTASSSAAAMAEMMMPNTVEGGGGGGEDEFVSDCSVDLFASRRWSVGGGKCREIIKLNLTVLQVFGCSCWHFTKVRQFVPRLFFIFILAQFPLFAMS